MESGPDPSGWPRPGAPTSAPSCEPIPGLPSVLSALRLGLQAPSMTSPMGPASIQGQVPQLHPPCRFTLTLGAPPRSLLHPAGLWAQHGFRPCPGKPQTQWHSVGWCRGTLGARAGCTQSIPTFVSSLVLRPASPDGHCRGHILQTGTPRLSDTSSEVTPWEITDSLAPNATLLPQPQRALPQVWVCFMRTRSFWAPRDPVPGTRWHLDAQGE